MKKLCLLWAICLFSISSAIAAGNKPTVAFYYGEKPPLMDLQAFDVAVVEPDFVENPQQYERSAQDGEHTLFAYVSLGEVQPSRAYYPKLPKSCLVGSNAAWGSRVINQTCPSWSAFFLDTIIEPLWKMGWRGFFVDTLDSYQIFAKEDVARLAQTQAMVGILRELKRRHPEARLMLNRGFELMPDIANITYAVAAESLYQGYDAGKLLYRPVPESDRAWLLSKMTEVRDRYHLPVISIDYVDPSLPNARKLARETAQQIRAQGFIPWVADGNLYSIGVGNIELIPRNVLVLVDTKLTGSPLGLDLKLTSAQRFIGAPLNYLGLRYEFVDLAEGKLPTEIMTGRYAGIVMWLLSGQNHPELGLWLKARIHEGVRVAMFNSFGFFPDNEMAESLGLQRVNTNDVRNLEIVSQDKTMMGFEVQPVPSRLQLVPFRLSQQGLKQGHSLLQLKDEHGNLYDAAAITAWGGYVLAPYDIADLRFTEQTRWVLNPLSFLRSALNLPDIPVPDVTTEGGRRMLMVHVDGDGFASRAEIAGSPYAASVMQKEFLMRYKVPTTVSVIEGEISASGPHKNISPVLEGIAKQIFALPYVEGASHSYTHSLRWGAEFKHAEQEGVEKNPENSHSIEIPGYTFNLTREVKGSMDYINTKLMPAGKRSMVFLWTGDCSPPSEAIAEAYKHGYLNMNGGETLITRGNQSLTMVFSQGIRKNGQYQIYAPNQNENVYTNNWTGPFYGYQRVIETFNLTNLPYRLKPIDIYYHVYSASKAGAISALHKVYQWALAQPLTAVYGSQYIRKVLDFEATTLSRDGETGDLWVRTGADLRTLRQSGTMAFNAFSGDTGVVGITHHTDPSVPTSAVTYLTLASGQSRLPAKPSKLVLPYIAEASGQISDFSRTMTATHSTTRFTLTSHGAAIFSLAQADACDVRVNNHPLTATKGKNSLFSLANALPNNVESPSTKQGTRPLAYRTYEPDRNNQTAYFTSRHLVLIQCRL